MAKTLTKRYNDQAIVLRTYKLADADRIIILLTKANGKVRAVAKGVRKMKSRFGSKLELFSYLDIQIHRGRGELDFIVEAEIRSQFPVIRTSLRRQDSTFAILEAVDLVALEAKISPRLFQMLLGALNLLEKEDLKLVVPAFYLKLLTLEGFKPVLEQCVVCSSSGPLVRFDYEEGGMCCAKCGKGDRVSKNAQGLMSDILGGRMNQALKNTYSGGLEKEIAEFSISLMEHRLERRLKAGRSYAQIFK